MNSNISDCHCDDFVILHFERIADNASENGDMGSNPHKFVSDIIAFWFQLLISILVCGCVSILGILANITNIVIFTKQGIFTDNGSVSLLGLAVADLFCVISMLWYSISLSLVLLDPPNISWNPWDIMYLTGGWPHIIFAQITRTVTAYVAFERCVCVVFPFKVKTLFTPWRGIAVFVGIIICFGLSYSPLLFTHQFKYTKDIETNATRLVLVSSKSDQQTVDVMLYFTSYVFNIGSVTCVVLCTMVTVSRVKLSKVWRESLGTGSSSKSEISQKAQNNQCASAMSINKDSSDNAISKDKGKTQKMSTSKMQKERNLVRIITLISIIMLISYIPEFLVLIMSNINPDIRMMRKHENLVLVMYSLTFLLETTSSSINIIVYYKMSTKYRKDLNALLGWKET